jgi:Flp pilus assembly protein TadG
VRTRRPRWHHDDGFIAGADGLMIGLTIMVAATLLFANLWGVLAARMATQEAAAAAARAYVEAHDSASASAAARRVAIEVLETHHRHPSAVQVSGERWERCGRVVVTVTTEVSRFPLPGLSGASHFTVSSSHSEIVDPYRSSDGLPGEVNCES